MKNLHRVTQRRQRGTQSSKKRKKKPLQVPPGGFRGKKAGEAKNLKDKKTKRQK
jgi:hypothetical protein